LVPFLGSILDRNLDKNLQQKEPAIYSMVSGEHTTTTYGMTYRPLDKTKIEKLPDDMKTKVNTVTAETKQGSLKLVSLLPAGMFLCYLSLIMYFKARGGYRAQDIAGEVATGGVPAPVR